MNTFSRSEPVNISAPRVEQVEHCLYYSSTEHTDSLTQDCLLIKGWPSAFWLLTAVTLTNYLDIRTPALLEDASAS